MTALQKRHGRPSKFHTLEEFLTFALAPCEPDKLALLEGLRARPTMAMTLAVLISMLPGEEPFRPAIGLDHLRVVRAMLDLRTRLAWPAQVAFRAKVPPNQLELLLADLRRVGFLIDAELRIDETAAEEALVFMLDTASTSWPGGAA